MCVLKKTSLKDLRLTNIPFISLPAYCLKSRHSVCSFCYFVMTVAKKKTNLSKVGDRKNILWICNKEKLGCLGQGCF